MNRILILLGLAGLLLPRPAAFAQPPVFTGVLAVNTNDCASVLVTLRLRNLPATFHLAMARHAVAWADDAYWRRVEAAEAVGGVIELQEDGLWRVTAPGGDATVRYRIRLDGPVASRVVQRPFIRADGGLLGDEHMFMYVVEARETPLNVTLDFPAGWRVATPLAPTANPRVFHARNAQQLCDSPILAGNLHESRFLVDQTPIRVAFLPLPGAKSFDEKPLVDGIENIVQVSSKLFGGLPWREYLFQLRDGAEEMGLEHFDCATIGVSSAAMAAVPSAKGMTAAGAMTLAHAYFHAWNMMRIHGAGDKGVDYRPARLSSLWLSEGFTIYYADLLLRRAGLPADSPSRLEHLEALIADYAGRPANSRWSAEASSRAAGTADLGDTQPDIWTQGEMIAVMLDFAIRDATNGKKSLDDLMRLMFARFHGEQGFTTKDVEHLAGEVCGRSMARFFNEWVRGSRKADMDRYLALAGLKARVEWKKATLPDGTLLGDRRIEADVLHGESSPRLQLWGLDNAWGRAGIRTWDLLTTFNGAPVQTYGDFESFRDGLRPGDTASIGVIHEGKVRRVTVAVGTYEWPVVKIIAAPNSTERQKRILDDWKTAR